MSRVQKIIIIRHPQTIWEDSVKNPDDADYSKRLLGITDIGLSNNGKVLASKIAQFVQGYMPFSLWSSPLQRAKETVSEIVRESRVGITFRSALREINFGDCEGLVFSQIQERYPEVYFGYLAQSLDIVFPSGESFADFRRRVKECVEGIVQTEAGTVVVVTHGGVARVMINYLLKFPDSFFWNIKQHHGAINILSAMGDSFVIERLNHTVRE